MARTYRDKIYTAAAYAARRALWDTLPIGAYPDQFVEGDAEHSRNFQRLKGGDMVMSHRTSGVWDDCRPKQGNGKDRKQQRRLHKRRERQKVQRQIREEV